MIDRPQAWWHEHVLRRIHSPQQPLHGFLARDATGILGYILYEQVPIAAPVPLYDIRCAELIWRSRRGLEAILSFVREQGWHAQRLIWPGSATDVTAQLLGQLGTRVDWRLLWMARPMSLEAALASRGYPDAAPCEIGLTVVDPLVDTNAASWLLAVDNGRGTVSRLKAAHGAGCELDIGTLTALYTGWLQPSDAVRLGRLRASERQVQSLAALFTGPTPWLAEHF